MRLQLTVQRHNLPPVHVLWTAHHVVRPPYAAAGTSITISQFLEQVNEIIPLESDDWGLEDYAVEVHGYECLHFSELGQMFEKDDEVCIRPLQTSDLRVRKISGRHQISVDGKHLIDGVAFGRPFLRRADRPPVRIPPRKRRRITYDEDEDLHGEELVDNRQIVVRAGFENTDDTGSEEGSEDHEEFAPDEEEGGDLDDELQGLLEDGLAEEGEDEATVGDTDKPSIEDGQGNSRLLRRSRRSPKGLGLLELRDDEGRRFPMEYSNPLLDHYDQDEPSTQHVSLKRRKCGGQKSFLKLSNRMYNLQDSSASPERVRRRDAAATNKIVRFQDTELATPATIRDQQDSSDGDENGNEEFAQDGSDKENTEPLAESSDFSDISDSSSSTSTFSDLEPNESDETSSSGCSSNESSPDADGVVSSRNPNAPPPDETSSSGSSSSSNDSEPEVQKATENQNPCEVTPSTSVEFIEEFLPACIKPGKGLSKTKNRNVRRRDSRKLAVVKKKGLLPANATKSDLASFFKANGQADMAEIPSGRDQPVESISTIPSSELEAFEKRRQALLESMSSSAEVVSQNDIPEIAEHPSTSVVEDSMAGVEDTDKQVLDSNPIDSGQEGTITRETEKSVSDEVVEKTPMEASTTVGASSSTLTSAPTSQPRRSRLDLSSSKRLLFGALGVKTPKSKEDESNLRAKLMKDVRPTKETLKDSQAKVADASTTTVDDLRWKANIDLRAVECCYDNIELSAPPFPFVQRWDPQQQRGNFSRTGGRRNKKRKRNNDSYYEESSYYDENFRLASQNKAARQEISEQGTPLDDQGPQEYERSHDESFEDAAAANDQLIRESQDRAPSATGEAKEVPDLPSLPEDLSIYATLTMDTCRSGTVIAFKKLDMSADTNWQPTVSEYRTAKIELIVEGGRLLMTLAKRDQPTNEGRYDEETGERIYTKFEMPGYNNGDHEDDDVGSLEMNFNELIDPIFVRAPHESPDQGQQRQGQEDIDEQAYTSNPLVRDSVHISFSSQTDAGLNRSLDGATDDNPSGPSEEDRCEISELIRHAGQRSSIPSGVNEELVIQEGKSPAENDVDNEAGTTLGGSSPTFGGFNSSPLATGFSDMSYPLDAEFRNSQPRHATGDVIAESVPLPDHVDSDAHSSHAADKSKVDYRGSPQVDKDSSIFQPQVDDDSILLQCERHQQPRSFEKNYRTSSQELISPPPSRHAAAQRTGSRTRASQMDSPPRTNDEIENIESEDEFPPLWSQAFESRLSQDISIKEEFPEFSDEEDAPSLPRLYSRPKANARSLQEAPIKEELSNDKEFPKRKSKPNKNRVKSSQDDSASGWKSSGSGIKSSQIVDLTISSDPLDSNYINEDDNYKLPKGSGWVKKTRASKGSS